VELDLPLWFNGRPDRFSGLEIVGAALEQEAIAHTLKDCCLEEQVIAYYQEQIKQSLESSESSESSEPLEDVLKVLRCQILCQALQHQPDHSEVD
jgi:hypothetical protein